MSDCKCSCHEDKCCGCQKRLESERDRLKAELDIQKTLLDSYYRCEQDRKHSLNLWKSKWESEHSIADVNYERRKIAESKAAKLAAALFAYCDIQMECHCEIKPCPITEAKKHAKAALAEFEEEK